MIKYHLFLKGTLRIAFLVKDKEIFHVKGDPELGVSGKI